MKRLNMNIELKTQGSSVETAVSKACQTNFLLGKHVSVYFFKVTFLTVSPYPNP